jgi:predicted RNA-binding protein with PIN domain
MRVRVTYIDAYNVMHRMPRLRRLLKSDADAARRSFVEHVRTHPAAHGTVVVVFDGHGEAITSGRGMRVVFSLTRTADSWIRAALEADAQRPGARVVSSDGDVCAHARACGADIMDADAFLADTGAAGSAGTSVRTDGRRAAAAAQGTDRTGSGASTGDEKRSTPLSASEIEEWKRLFEER